MELQQPATPVLLVFITTFTVHISSNFRPENNTRLGFFSSLSPVSVLILIFLSFFWMRHCSCTLGCTELRALPEHHSRWRSVQRAAGNGSPEWRGGPPQVCCFIHSPQPEDDASPTDSSRSVAPVRGFYSAKSRWFQVEVRRIRSALV